MRCKQGDDAVIIKSEFKENIGALVRIVKAYGEAPPDWSGMSGKFCWYITRLDGKKLAGTFLENNDKDYFNRIVTADSNLQPIRGVPKTTESTKNEEITA